MDKNPTAFISYSWDSKEHKDWITNLANLLRDNGVDATIDVFETQKGTVNLNAMMLKNIKNNDYTIIVLTQNYAEKADAFQGGVGFETNMLISYIQENLQKIIPIMRCKGDKAKAVPFYLSGVHYIDFSEPHDFEEKFNELLHRIYRVDLVAKSPLGKRPDLKTKIIGGFTQMLEGDFDDLIPNFREITDIDKNIFMKDSYVQIRDGFLQLLVSTKERNSNFNFDYENVTSRKAIYRVYINGHQKYAVKVWLGSSFGAGIETINLAYGNHISDSDNSMNEIITCEVARDKTLELKMTMNMFGNKKANTPAAILREIWANIVRWLE